MIAIFILLTVVICGLTLKYVLNHVLQPESLPSASRPSQQESKDDPVYVPIHSHR
ncbi:MULTISPECIES: hypothetical protein [Bacillus]|jgi:hypothetical protein|uniref:Uncharacterized protein n=1 Tax=Bacillus smithii 7_3_47FAA TaxID=665952 RepID=G9QP05_9BACI|nr:hypothetical protein [Bacillus smithii]EHL74550.1 hypothetical protein HMPREF1015_00022 [Bacillus smithii 7_3_47FAA]MED1490304.1 hypothetical protein [Bacillus smithii]